MSTTEDQALDLIASAITEVTGTPGREVLQLGLDRDIKELGLDSVGSLEVAGVLERELGREFPDDRLARVKSINDLIALVQER